MISVIIPSKKNRIFSNKFNKRSINWKLQTTGKLRRPNKQIDIPWTWIGKLNTVKMVVVLISYSVISDSFATPLIIAYQAPLSLGFPRQGYWSWLPFPSPGGLLDPGIKPTSLAWQANSLPLSHLESPVKMVIVPKVIFRFTIIPIKISPRIFGDPVKFILKFTWKHVIPYSQQFWVKKKTKTKTKVGELTFPCFKIINSLQ